MLIWIVELVAEMGAMAIVFVLFFGTDETKLLVIFVIIITALWAKILVREERIRNRKHH